MFIGERRIREERNVAYDLVLRLLLLMDDISVLASSASCALVISHSTVQPKCDERWESVV